MKPNKKSVVFLVNPISGTHSKKELPELIDAVLDKELFDYRILYTEYAGHAAEMARQFAAEQTRGQHQEARADEKVGYFRRGKAEFLVEDQGHDRPDHTAEIGDHPAEKEDIDLAPQTAILVQ